MNIEIKPIAESKIRQLGGDVCGVLVRTEDSEVMAVSEHGRCTRLDAGVMGPVVVAYDPEVCTHGDADDDAACEECIEKWTRQAARAQSGQGAEPDWSASKTLESEGWKNPLLSKNDRLQIADGAVAWRDEVIKNLRSRTPQQGRVPEAMTALVAICQHLRGYVDNRGTSIVCDRGVNHFLDALKKAEEVTEQALATTPQPEGDARIDHRCELCGHKWSSNNLMDECAVCTKRPQPPQEGE